MLLTHLQIFIKEGICWLWGHFWHSSGARLRDWHRKASFFLYSELSITNIDVQDVNVSTCSCDARVGKLYFISDHCREHFNCEPRIFFSRALAFFFYITKQFTNICVGLKSINPPLPPKWPRCQFLFLLSHFWSLWSFRVFSFSFTFPLCAILFFSFFPKNFDGIFSSMRTHASHFLVGFFPVSPVVQRNLK